MREELSRTDSVKDPQRSLLHRLAWGADCRIHRGCFRELAAVDLLKGRPFKDRL